MALAVVAASALAACGGPRKADIPAALSTVSAPPTIDRVLVLKHLHRLYLISGSTIVESFPVALGANPLGPKLRQGDHRTPEGTYMLDWRNPKSAFYRSIHISYPNESDRARARRGGYSPGGDIMIHGLPNGLGFIGADHTREDWTDGCIAVTNRQMDVIWKLVSDNTPIEVRP